jgi:hypothetical protein
MAQPATFLLQGAQGPRFVYSHRPILALPPVIGLHPDVVRANRLHRTSRPHLAQDSDPLFFTESTLSSSASFSEAELPYVMFSFGGQIIMLFAASILSV